MQRNQKLLLFVGIPVVLLGLCLCAGLLFFVIADSEGSTEAENGRSRSKRALADACLGSGVAEAAAYANTTGIHPVVFMQKTEDDYLFLTETAPAAWNAAFLDEAELVVCVENQVESIVETCEYTLDAGGDATISRISINAEFRLVEAQTGTELLRDKVTAVPRDCLEEETFNEGETAVNRRGSLMDALIPVVTSYVEIP